MRIPVTGRADKSWGFMRVVDLEKQPREGNGARASGTRMRASGARTARRNSACSSNGAIPARRADPSATRSRRCYDVLQGQAEVWIGDSRTMLTDGQLWWWPAGHRHGFSNAGTGTLSHHIDPCRRPVFEAAYDRQRETPRRWRRLSAR